MSPYAHHRTPVRLLRVAIPAAAGVSLLWACGSLPFLRDDPSAPRDRASRFDRFVAELDLALTDTAPLLERVRRATSGESLTSLEWDEERRRAVRRTVIESAVRRLEREFPPGRLDADRAVVSRVLLADLAPLSAAARALDPGEPSVTLADLAATPWSGLLVEAPSVLAREHPRTNASDLEAWTGTMEAVVDASSIVAIPMEAVLAEDSPGTNARGRALRVVVDSTLVSAVTLQASAGAGGPLDPLLGPLEGAASELRGPDARRFRDASRRVLGLSIARTFRDLVARLEETLTASSGGTLFRTGPLEAEDFAAWIRLLRQAAGPDATPEMLQALARSHIGDETKAIAEIFGDASDNTEAARAVLRRIRDRELEIPGSDTPPREPQLLWSEVERSLDQLVAATPQLAIEWSLAGFFERPHGRWSPFIPGDLVPTGDPRSRPAQYLAPRPSDVTVPAWLRDAEAYRYGIPGRGVMDAFRRAANDVPSILRWRTRAAFEEGWGLYAVQMAAEQNALPEVDRGFGRHAQELIAHAALLVDVGLHSEGWSRRQSIDYLLSATPLSEAAASELVLRCLAHPGRMALPAIGLLRIRTLERGVQEALGEDFDLAEFHRALLKGGPIPISEMDARVQRWLAAGGERND